MPLPLLWAAGAGLASAGISEYQRRNRRRELEAGLNRARPPSIDFGLRRKNMASQIGQQRTNQARGFGESQAGRGVDDPGAAASAGRGFASDAASRLDEGYANIQDQQDAYDRAVAEWEERKAGIMSEQPDITNSLAEGLQTGMSVYQMANPQAFTTQYPQTSAQPQSPPGIDFGFKPQIPSVNLPQQPPSVQLGVRPYGSVPTQAQNFAKMRYGNTPNFAQPYQMTEQTINYRRPQFGSPRVRQWREY